MRVILAAAAATLLPLAAATDYNAAAAAATLAAPGAGRPSSSRAALSGQQALRQSRPPAAPGEQNDEGQSAFGAAPSEQRKLQRHSSSRGEQHELPREGASRDADTPYWRSALQSVDLERADDSGALSASDLGRTRTGRPWCKCGTPHAACCCTPVLLGKLKWCHCRLVHASLTPRRGGAWYAAASTDVDAALGAVPVVDQNGFIITPGGSGPGVPAASWHHDYTKEAQRLKKWRAMLGAPAGACPRLGARRPGCRARQRGAPRCARLPGHSAALACATILRYGCTRPGNLRRAVQPGGERGRARARRGDVGLEALCGAAPQHREAARAQGHPGPLARPGLAAALRRARPAHAERGCGPRRRSGVAAQSSL